MTEILFIRHGQPASGGADPALSAQGRDQAKRVGRWLAAEQVDVILSSPMLRAHETATIAAAEMSRGIDHHLDNLREWDLDLEHDGTYVALEDLAEDHPRRTALLSGRYEDFIPTIDRAAFLARAAGATDTILERWAGKRVAAFTHGGFINAQFAGLLGLEERLFFFLPDYTSINRLRVMPGGRRVMGELNGAAHLVGTRDPGLALSPA